MRRCEKIKNLCERCQQVTPLDKRVARRKSGQKPNKQINSQSWPSGFSRDRLPIPWAIELCGLLKPPAERQEATARCANRRLPVSFKALIRRGSPIGGHARQQMIPLAPDLLPFPGQMRREDHLKSASPPDRLFFIWSHYHCGHHF